MANEIDEPMRNERVRCLVENPDVATPNEIRRLAREVIAARTARAEHRDHFFELQTSAEARR